MSEQDDFISTPDQESPQADQSTDELGSLAQSARGGHLKTARTTMYVIGVLTLLLNGGLFLFAEPFVNNQIDAEVKKLQGPGVIIDHAEVDRIKQQAIKATQLASIGFVVVGVIFLVLGAQVENYPLPCTVLGLVLYLAGQAITALFDPTMLVRGILIKIIIVVALVNAIKAASAFERERAATA